MNSEEIYNELLKSNDNLDKRLRSEIVYLLINGASLLTLGVISAYTYFFEVAPQVVPVDASGSLFESKPLDQATMSDKELKQWYVDAIKELFDFNYRNMLQHPDSVSHLFTIEGLRDFDKYVNTSKFGKKVKANYGIVEVIIDDKVTVSQGTVAGRLGWQMSAKIALMIYMNGKPMRVGVYDITAITLREDQNVSPTGVVIKNITLKEVSN